MSRRRIALVFSLSLLASAPTAFALSDGSNGKPVRMDAAKIRQLIQIVQSEPDEEKRRAAVVELGRADPRHINEVIHAVTQALLKDASPSVRLAAVEVIVGYRSVFPLTGVALETAVEADSSPIVRNAARHALWEYHLNGYKSARGTDVLFAQSEEPPLARRPPPPVPVTAEPPVKTVVAELPPSAVSQLPAVGPAPGPRVTTYKPSGLIGRGLPHSNLTVEPPLAPIPGNMPLTLPSPTVTEPPILPPGPETLAATIVSPTPYGIDLPSIVTNPGPIPGVTPLPDETGEPPIARR